jgi:hypothetical protein
MGAFSIAFDIVIVSALAIPWVLLVIHLFFSDNESGIRSALNWVSQQNQPAVVGVLLFAMAFSLGSAVSRIAQDFFDDDDLHIFIADYEFQVGVTETNIRTDVYCQTLHRGVVPQKPGEPLTENRQKFRNADPGCDYTGKWILQRSRKSINDQQGLAEDDFHLQEAAVLLKGTDDTERLRQFHDQIMVLRAAAFNGLIVFSLCLFWWSAKFRSSLRWALVLIFLCPAIVASFNHSMEHANSPPFMEATLFMLGAAGCRLLWRPTSKAAVLPPVSGAPALGQVRFAYLALSLFLAVAAFLGWWATQVLYDQQVFYSYRAMTEAPPSSANANQK